MKNPREYVIKIREFQILNVRFFLGVAGNVDFLNFEFSRQKTLNELFCRGLEVAYKMVKNCKNVQYFTGFKPLRLPHLFLGEAGSMDFLNLDS